jgi:hypothetical protein
MTPEQTRTDRPWALRRWCVVASLVLALLAEIALIAATGVALASGNFNPGVWVLPLGWPMLYAATYALACGIAVIDRRGPVSGQFPRWYTAFFSRFDLAIADAMYSLIPNVVLVVLPAFASCLGIVILWAAATGQLN